MKINELFDDLPADALEQLIDSNPAPAPADLSSLKAKVRARTGLEKPSRLRWQPLVATAACLCLILGAVALVGRDVTPAPPDPGPTETGGSTITWPFGLHTISEMQAFFGTQNVLWDTGGDSIEGEDSPSGCEVPSNSPYVHLQWNGINLSEALYAQVGGNGLVAICIQSSQSPWASLSHDETYLQWCDTLEEAAQECDDLQQLLEHAERYDSLSAEDREDFWSKLAETLDPDFARQYFDGEAFDMEAIEWAYQLTVEAYEGAQTELRAYQRIYLNRFAAEQNLPDLTKLQEMFYVVEEQDVQIVILYANALDVFAQTVLETYTQEQLESTCFCLATAPYMGDIEQPSQELEGTPVTEDVPDLPSVEEEVE